MKKTIIFDLEGTLIDDSKKINPQVFISETYLSRLYQDYLLSIVTGASRAQLNRTLSNTFLGKYFEAANTITVDECSEPKSSGVPFKKLVEKRDLPSPLLVIGDSTGDELGAKSLDVDFIKVNPEKMTGDQIDLDDYLKKYFSR